MEEILKCPGCCDIMRKSVLKDEEDKDYNIDFCVACGGVWLDGGELKKALSTKEKVPMKILNIAPYKDKSEIDEILEGHRICPRCKRQTLELKEIAGVKIDFCTECAGIWLDRGEFSAILAKSPSNTLLGKMEKPDYYRPSDPNKPYQKIPNNYKPGLWENADPYTVRNRLYLIGDIIRFLFP